MVRDVELAESIKSTTPKMCIVSDEQSDPHDDTCPVCLDEGFSTDTGDKLGRECGLCGSTGNIQYQITFNRSIVVTSLDITQSVF